LIDLETNEFYAEITQSSLTCKLVGKEVNTFNATMLVNEENGRSLASPSTYFVTSDEKIYNFLAYSEISSLSTNASSEAGGNFIDIHGLYFYSDEYLPAEIEIGGNLS
jgi:hypothetical protein